MTEWKPVIGYEGVYEVSDAGQVWSVRRSRLLKQSINPQHGRLSVSLHRDGLIKRFLVHRLVLLAFVGPCPIGMECCHFDDDPTNNRLPNLRWDTRSSNIADRVRNGWKSPGRTPRPESCITHCRRGGHEFTPENTVWKTKTSRNCRACLNELQNERRRQRKLSSHA